MSPVDAGACADPGEVGAVGSGEAVALDTAVAMLSAAAGMFGRATDGMRGRTGDFVAWCCSLGCWACAPWPAGVPEVGALGDLALGEDGVPVDCPPLPTRFARVGFTACGLVGELGVLGDSACSAVVALGISGSWCGSTSGA
ncbi:hypothetical protein [Mycobacteroides abscessus]|uniref:hypothetical protein n=1 Tax=Mycobacteroides abscessus TaxID=36809 RepID=UPI001F2CA366|nr:hypothetical protein [Mycobacteroides abscessus]